jgi:uncharacterized protein with PQ loop repeat
MELTNYIIGLIGSIAFGICALPQAIQVYKTGNTDGLSGMFLLLWSIGEVFTFTYVIIDNIKTGSIMIPLYINYTLNGLLVGYLDYKKIVNRRLSK